MSFPTAIRSSISVIIWEHVAQLGRKPGRRLVGLCLARLSSSSIDRSNLRSLATNLKKVVFEEKRRRQRRKKKQQLREARFTVI